MIFLSYFAPVTLTSWCSLNTLNIFLSFALDGKIYEHSICVSIWNLKVLNKYMLKKKDEEGEGREEGKKGRKEGGRKHNNVDDDELIKQCMIWWLQNSKRKAIIPCFSCLKIALFSTWWKIGFPRSNLLQACRFLSLRITKFIKIPEPPGRLNRDNWYHHPSPLLLTTTEAHFFCTPQESITFTRQSVVIPSIVLCELRPQSSISSGDLSEGFTPAKCRLHVCL